MYNSKLSNEIFRAPVSSGFVVVVAVVSAMLKKLQ
jgi:hypothetical protein